MSTLIFGKYDTSRDLSKRIFNKPEFGKMNMDKYSRTLLLKLPYEFMVYQFGLSDAAKALSKITESTVPDSRFYCSDTSLIFNFLSPP